VLQPVAPHANPLGQAPPVVDEQLPAPSHLPSQAAPQMTDVAGYVHAVPDAPVQAPPQVPDPLHAVRVPCGTPSLVVVQVPIAPVTSHA